MNESRVYRAIDRLKWASAANERAAKALLAATEAALPVGMEIAVTLGRARIEGKVEGHGCWWSRPADVHIRNMNTGKLRWMNAIFDDWRPIL